MKIAAVFEDGVTISQHFGRAPFYVVLVVEGGRIVTSERRDKLRHNQFEGQSTDHAHEVDSAGHGFSASAQKRHARMLAGIADCDVLLARGMGSGAYESMKQANIRPIVTDLANIGEAVQAYLAGSLEDHIENLH